MPQVMPGTQLEPLLPLPPPVNDKQQTSLTLSLQSSGPSQPNSAGVEPPLQLPVVPSMHWRPALLTQQSGVVPLQLFIPHNTPSKLVMSGGRVAMSTGCAARSTPPP